MPLANLVLPTHPAGCGVSPGFPALARPGMLRHIVKAAQHVQVPLIGLALLATPLAPAPSPGAARLVILGLCATVLARVTGRSWPAPARGHPALGASGLFISMALAFGTLAMLSWLAEGSWHHSSFVVIWCVAASTFAALLGLVRPELCRTVIAAEGGRVTALQRALSGCAASQGMCVVGTLDLADPGYGARLDTWLAAGEVTMVVVPAGLDDRHLHALRTQLCDTAAHLRAAFVSGVDGEIPPMADVLPPPISGVRWAIKRGFDLTVSIALLVLLAPLLLSAAAAIRLESPGPALFRQWRFGQGGKAVLIYKFRTMRCEAADVLGAARTLARDPRVTPLGRILRRLSIDELPQLFNVVRGEMSLVGPRPHATHMQVEGRMYHDAVETYRARHRVLPGITGWAQVNGSRGEVDTLEKAHSRVRLDLWYIANWSPVLDLWILLRTVLGGFATLGAD